MCLLRLKVVLLRLFYKGVSGCVGNGKNNLQKARYLISFSPCKNLWASSSPAAWILCHCKWLGTSRSASAAWKWLCHGYRGTAHLCNRSWDVFRCNVKYSAAAQGLACFCRDYTWMCKLSTLILKGRCCYSTFSLHSAEHLIFMCLLD